MAKTVRVTILVGVLACLVVLFGPGSSGFGIAPEEAKASAQSSKPNVIFIMTDDLDYASAQQMPSINSELKQKGAYFENFFNSLSWCCPSRATALTGLYAHNHGVISNKPPSGGFAKFRDSGYEADTIATRMQTGGYQTAYLGKYLNGYPTADNRTYVPPGWDEWYGKLAGDQPEPLDYRRINENGQLVLYGTGPENYYTDVLSRQATSFVQREASNPDPFFMYLAPTAPHEPATPAERHKGAFAGQKAPRPPSFDEADVSDKPSWIQNTPRLSATAIDAIDARYRNRMESMLAVDEMVAALVKELQATGQLDNTYIMFTSDNGWFQGEHRIEREKNRPYEESARAPLFIRGPGVAANSTVEKPAVNTDLAPTFAELTGVPSPAADGRSLKPMLGSGNPSWRTAVLLEGYSTPGPYFAVRTETHKYVEYRNGEKELYDLEADPYELESIHNSADPALLADLKTRLDALRACAGDACREAEGNTTTQDTSTQDTTLVSGPGRLDSSHASVSSNGRYVAFQSDSNNLVTGDTNGKGDVFVYDRQAKKTEQVSLSSAEAGGNGGSGSPSISSDGRYVAFESDSDNLAAGDANGKGDAFVRDRTAGTTERVSLSSSEAEGDSGSGAPSISSDGRYVAFESDAANLAAGDTNGKGDAFVRDRTAGTTERVSLNSSKAEGNGISGSPSISSDGRYVAFESDAANLAAGDTNGKGDAFVRDRTAGTTERVSLSSSKTEGNGISGSPSISSDGRYVAFESDAANLAAGDTNGKGDAFVRDRTAGTTERVSLSSSEAGGTNESASPSISPDGRYVAFESFANNLVTGDTNGRGDVFVRDRSAGTTERASVDGSGVQANGESYAPSAGPGGLVAFESPASNLAANDTNGKTDVFARGSTDTTPPGTAITSGPSGTVNSGSASFSFSSTEAGSTFECKLDGGAWGACTSPKSYTGLSDGSHNVQVRAKDAAGNVDATPASRNWAVDTTAPETTISSGPAEGSTQTSASAAFEFSSEAGSTFECKLDGGAWGACTSPKSYAGLSDGSHNVQVRAKDAAGNVDATPASRIWTVDASAPETTVTSGPAEGSTQTSASASFSFSSSETGSTFECKLDSGAWGACTSPKSYTGLSSGSHTFSVRATDAAGNVDATPASRTWTVDTAPDTTITSGPADGSAQTSASASFGFSSTKAGSTFECKLDGGAWGACTSPKSYTGLSSGSHTFSVRAKDATGSVDATPASRTWTVDTTAPETTITSGPAEGSTETSASAAFEFSSSEAGSTFECSLDSGAWSGCISPKDYTGLSDGSHTVQVRAKDAAGNVDATPASRTWTVDATAPAVSSVTPADGATGVTRSASSINISAKFSEAMRPETLTSTTSTANPTVTLVNSSNGSRVAATVSYDAATRTAKLRPSTSLQYNTKYTVTVKGGPEGAEDQAGNPLATNKVWSFTTVRDS